MQTQILFQSPDFTIINKPSGLSCHNDNNSVEKEFSSKIHFVNRLDKETSGLMVITEKPELQNELNLALKAGQKKYICILRGNLPPNTDWLSWNFPISDKAEGRQNPQGDLASQVPSETLYRTLKSNSYFSLVECLLKTGRQHQIRKHSLLFGKPIIGDARYGNEKDNQRIAKMYQFQRLALHSYQLDFIWQNKDYHFACEIPEAFEYVFKH